MEEITSRQVAFRDLLRNVGQQLSQSDTSTIEFNERVPPQMRGKGGVMLLETLWKSGRFSPWKTQPLREILRLADRCDLADDTVKKYQMEFQDKDSPMSHHRPLERGTSTPVTGSPCLVHSHVRPHTAAPPRSPQWTPGHRRAQSDLPSLHSKESHATSELKHTLTEPHEEVGPSGPSMPSLPQSVQHFPAPYPYEPPGTAEYRGNGNHKHSNFMDNESNMPPSTPEHSSTSYESQSPTEWRVTSPDVSNCSSGGDPSHELKMRAIDALTLGFQHIVDVAMGASHSEASSRSSLPSYDPKSSQRSTPQTSLHSTPRITRGGGVYKNSLPQSLNLHQRMTANGKRYSSHRPSLPSDEHKSATLPRNFSTPATWNSGAEPETPATWNSGAEPEIFPMDPEITADDQEPRSTFPQPSSPAKQPEEQNSEHRELPSELPTAPPEVTSTPEGSDDSLPEEPAKDQQRSTSAKARIKSFLKLSRPLAAQRTPPLSSYQWKVKRDDMVKLVSKHSHAKVQSISCPCPLELDVSNPKHNPKLSLKLYPYGLFEDEGKSVSLQMNIVTPKKSPLISPSLQMKFTVTVLDDQGKTLRQQSTRQSLNMNVFYVFSLLTHDELIKGLQGECVELRASVQIEQQSV